MLVDIVSKHDVPLASRVNLWFLELDPQIVL